MQPRQASDLSPNSIQLDPLVHIRERKDESQKLSSHQYSAWLTDHLERISSTTSKSVYLTLLFSITVEKFINSVKQNYSYHHSCNAVEQSECAIWRQRAIELLSTDEVDPCRAMVNDYSDRSVCDSLLQVNHEAGDYHWWWYQYLDNTYDYDVNAAPNYDLHKAVIDYYCRQYRRAKERPEKNTDEINSLTAILNNFFNLAIAYHNTDINLTLLKSFLQIQDLGFQPSISIDLCALRNPSNNRGYFDTMLTPSRPAFEFLSENFCTSFENAIAKFACHYRAVDELRTITAMGASPLGLNYTHTEFVKRKSPAEREIYNSYAVNLLNAMRDYLIAHATDYQVHEYRFECLSHHFHFFGGKSFSRGDERVNLPHGIHKFVKAAEKANRKPHLASELLGDVLRHAYNTARPGVAKPEKRSNATQIVYQALGRWDTDSDIVKSIIKSIQKKDILAGLNTKTNLVEGSIGIICDYADVNMQQLIDRPADVGKIYGVSRLLR